MSHYANCLGGGSGDCLYPIVKLETISTGAVKATACDTGNHCGSITSAGTGYQDGKWHQVDLTHTGTNWTLYLDGGTGVGGSGVSGTLTDANSYLQIGADYSDDFTFRGLLGQIAVYPTALAGTRVTAHYTAATAAPTWSPISGATTSTYTAGAGDVNYNLRVLVTASNAAGNTTAPSNGTGSITGPGVPLNTVLPALSGTPSTNQTLTGDQGRGPARRRSRTRASGSGSARAMRTLSFRMDLSDSGGSMSRAARR